MGDAARNLMFRRTGRRTSTRKETKRALDELRLAEPQPRQTPLSAGLKHGWLCFGDGPGPYSCVERTAARRWLTASPVKDPANNPDVIRAYLGEYVDAEKR